MVRWRHVFRSDAMHLMTHADAARLRDDLKVATVIDLRSYAEAELEPYPHIEASFTRHHLPFILELPDLHEPSQKSTAFNLGEFYVGLINNAGGTIRAVLESLAASEAVPAVVHCSLGKDRTGVATAVLLGALGVGDKDIVRDYTLTNRYVGNVVRAARSAQSEESVAFTLPPEFLRAPASAMKALLATVRREYGSMREYAGSVGVDGATVSQLESALLT
jgi:protein-tyrosine phosphatase